jgi:hypothetical protein
MNKFRIFSIALLASATVSQAQDVNQAKKKQLMQSNLKVQKQF